MMVILGTLASVVIRVVDSKDSARAVTIKTGKETLNKDWLITKAKKKINIVITFIQTLVNVREYMQYWQNKLC